MPTSDFQGEQQQRLGRTTEDDRRNVWAPSEAPEETPSIGAAFPWLLNNAQPESQLPLDVPPDILHDGARVAALLDIRQMIGAKTDSQERLTHMLMDYDLHPMRGDYLIPGVESPLWQILQVSESCRRSIIQRIERIPHEALSQRVCWNGDHEVWVGHHKINIREKDVQTLNARWVPMAEGDQKDLEMARLLALYAVFDNPLSNRRSGVHLGLDPELRRRCDYELFASPLNAAVPNGHFASKWPHVECRFGSMGSYPSVLSLLPSDAVVCVNPPFTDGYLADVMARLQELKLRFRLRLAIPILETGWRKKLSALHNAQLLSSYYDASSERVADVLHPTLLWEDPRATAPGERSPMPQSVPADSLKPSAAETMQPAPPSMPAIVKAPREQRECLAPVEAAVPEQHEPPSAPAPATAAQAQRSQAVAVGAAAGRAERTTAQAAAVAAERQEPKRVVAVAAECPALVAEEWPTLGGSGAKAPRKPLGGKKRR